MLSSQPSLDAGQIQRKHFKLAMSVGKIHHYFTHQILPRRFVQTAEQAGVSRKIVERVIDDLKANANRKAAEVINGLQSELPLQWLNPFRIVLPNFSQGLRFWTKNSQ